MAAARGWQVKPLERCANGCDAAPCPPSLVLCRVCLDKLTAKIEAMNLRVNGGVVEAGPSARPGDACPECKRPMEWVVDGQGRAVECVNPECLACDVPEVLPGGLEVPTAAALLVELAAAFRDRQSGEQDLGAREGAIDLLERVEAFLGGRRPGPGPRSPVDCGDNGCRCAFPGGGMRTNGGCRCSVDERLRALPWFKAELRLARALGGDAAGFGRLLREAVDRELLGFTGGDLLLGRAGKRAADPWVKAGEVLDLLPWARTAAQLHGRDYVVGRPGASTSPAFSAVALLPNWRRVTGFPWAWVGPSRRTVKAAREDAQRHAAIGRALEAMGANRVDLDSLGWPEVTEGREATGTAPVKVKSDAGGASPPLHPAPLVPGSEA